MCSTVDMNQMRLNAFMSTNVPKLHLQAFQNQTKTTVKPP